MTTIDRLVRKEVSLGALREKTPPQDHIGLTQIAPFLEVASDDVIFDYIGNHLQDGLAPARAEDAESELSQKDVFATGQGRASLIDWAQKDRYTASEVTRYREDLLVQQALQGAGTTLDFNYTGRAAAEFQAKIARDDNSRKRRLDNRLEWLIISGLVAGKINYNDGKIIFSVDFGRPADQNEVTPVGGLWSSEDCDPIGAILAEQDKIYDRVGVRPTRGLISTKAVNSLWKSKRFLAAVGVPVVGGDPNVPLDPNYLGLSGYNPQGALAIVQQATGVSFTIYDSVYRTRPIGSTTYTNVRFADEKLVTLFPSEGDLGEIDDTQIGFAKTLTSPHPEGLWTPGWYEWEDVTRDPWMHVRGTGIKAFPVFPYLEYTSTLKVLA
jgi:hypothetical protein